MGANSKTRPELFTKFEREFEVPHFHRTVSDYFTALTQAGFTVTDLIEPELNDLLLNHSPGFHDYRGHPVGLIFACTKQ
jgi:hypothetical protein